VSGASAGGNLLLLRHGDFGAETLTHGPRQAHARRDSVRSTRAFVEHRPWIVPGIAPFGLLLWAELRHRVLAPDDGLGYYVPMHELARRSYEPASFRRGILFSSPARRCSRLHSPAPFYPLEAACLVLPTVLANNL
jgi:hypothetical protein